MEPTTLEHIFLWHVSLHSPPQKGLLRVLSEYAKDDEQKHQLRSLVSIKKKKEYEELLESSPSLLDLLIKFDKCIPTVQHLLSVLPKLVHRYYSVSSSPLSDKCQIHFAFTVVENNFPENDFFPARTRAGVCTGWLEKKALAMKNKLEYEEESLPTNPFKKLPANAVPLWLNINSYFKLPQALLSPHNEEKAHLLLFATGTGITPFRSFWRHIHALKQQNEAYVLPDITLVFGCRSREKDFLYNQEIEEMLQRKIISRLYTAFSREEKVEGEKRRYVDSVVRENQSFFADLVYKKDAVTYVCGDANGVVKSVQAIFLELFERELKMDHHAAQKFLDNLKQEKKYIVEIWS